VSDGALASDYQRRVGECGRLLREVTHQLEHLIAEAGVTLGVPLEGRIKSLSSILEKRARKARELSSITDFQDLIGLRVILIFHRDLGRLDQLLRARFTVVEHSDTASQLGSNQFGYQSLHYILKIRDEWLTLPTFSGLNEYVFELQLRTLAQHIWAVASHKLQYKREESVPQPVRRSISRVSALLETVDLEFDRVLSERETYVLEDGPVDTILNVDLLAATLDALLPEKNKDENGEEYDELLDELVATGIDTVSKLTVLIRETWAEVRKEEARRAADDPLDDPEEDWADTLDRHARGVFFTHAGLVRNALDVRFGDRRMLDWRMTKTYLKGAT